MKKLRPLVLVGSFGLLSALAASGCGDKAGEGDGSGGAGGGPIVTDCDSVTYQGCTFTVNCTGRDSVTFNSPSGEDGCTAGAVRVACDDEGCAFAATSITVMEPVAGTECAEDAECMELLGGYCALAGICTAECISHADCGCPAGTTQADIEAGGCSAACVGAGDASYCTQVCSTDADCEGDTECLETTAGGQGVCWPRGATVVETGLGESCEAPTDCETGLDCVVSDSDALTVGGPPHGMCSFECATDAECTEFDERSACIAFGDSSYCMQTCGIGDGDTMKCSARQDMACDQALVSTGQSCTDDLDCDITAFCVDGECTRLPMVCLPRCGTDNDCPVGRFCDPNTGECSASEPTGGGIGDTCDLDGGDGECAGLCLEESEGVGLCYELCRLGTYPACGSSSTTDGTAACLFAVTANEDPGDIGFCAGLCDCTSDCGSGHVCIQLEDAQGTYEYLGRPGICVPPPVQATETELTICGTGAGGAGSD